MTELAIRVAGRDDLIQIDQMLRNLAKDLNDPFHATIDRIADVLFGANAPCFAVLAKDGEMPRGVALCSPVFSTSRGGMGVYVSDLWVSSEMRGQKLGPKLLTVCAEHGQSLWNALFLKLSVYDDNPRAQKFYSDLGFAMVTGENVMTITHDDLTKWGHR